MYTQHLVISLGCSLVPRKGKKKQPLAKTTNSHEIHKKAKIQLDNIAQKQARYYIDTPY